MKGFVLVGCMAPLLFCADALANYRTDVNRDGTVNFLDVAELSDCFLENTAINPECASEDINQDGSVNFLDLAALSDFFLAGRPNFSDNQRFAFPAVRSEHTSASFVDLDSDGDTDMYTSTAYFNVASDQFISYSSARFNLGPLDFNIEGSVAATVPEPLVIRRPHDFDGDGLLDLVRVDNFTNWPRVYRQQSDQSFVPWLIPSMSCSSLFLRTHDLNQDGNTDIMCISPFPGGDGPRIYLGDDNTYASEPDIELGNEQFDMTNQFAAIEILDVNDDGWDDILVAKRSDTATAGLKIYFSDQNGDFVIPTDYFLEAQSIRDILIADLDGNGVKDFAVHSDEPGMQSLYVYIVEATGPVALPPETYPELGILTASVNGGFVAVDTDGDGDKELVALDSDESFDQLLRFYDFDSVNGLVELFTVPVAPNLTAFTPRAGYFNDDSIEDLGFSGNDLVTFIMSEFPNSYKVAERYEAAGSTADVSSLNLSSDEFPDLVVAYSEEHSVGIRLNTTGKPQTIEAFYDVGVAPSEILVGDLNSDGEQDIVVVSNDNASVSVLIANGIGGFLPYAEYSTGLDSRQFELADVDNNGTPDLHTGSSLLLGNGLGGFDAPMPLAIAPEWSAYRFAYVNDDSFPDIVYGTSSSIEIRLTVDDCVFCGSTVELSVPGSFPSVSSIAVDDLDNDLDHDIVVSSESTFEFGVFTYPKVAVYTNNGSNSFTESQVSSLLDIDSVNASIRDVNGDGWNDIVAGKLTVYFSNEGDFSSAPITFNMSSATNYTLVDLDLDDLIDLVCVIDDGHYIHMNR